MEKGHYRGHAATRALHGGIRPAQLRALGLDPADALDFSASVSPLGPPQGLWEALQRVDLAAYPDPDCLELREALAGHHGIEIDRILVGNGSTELIHLLAQVFLSPPSGNCANTALLLTPTYGEYAGACALAGATTIAVESRRESGFSWDLDAAEEIILAQRPALIFLCNPNNPTGVYLGREDVKKLAGAARAVGSLLALDEAYLNFVEERWDSGELLDGQYGDSVVILRSMTKDYALTSLRLGYSLSGAAVRARLAARQPDWSVNGFAQAAGLVALADADYLPAARQATEESKAYLTEELNALGLRVLPAAANFLLVEVGDAARWSEGLRHRGIFVRDCASFDLPDCVRIGVRAMPDCQRLVAAVKEQRGI